LNRIQGNADSCYSSASPRTLNLRATVTLGGFPAIPSSCAIASDTKIAGESSVESIGGLGEGTNGFAKTEMTITTYLTQVKARHDCS
jgi:hypothetical protein